jgi:hypothetical protein
MKLSSIASKRIGDYVWVVNTSYADSPSDCNVWVYSSYEKAREKFLSLLPGKEEYEESEEYRMEYEGTSETIPYDEFIRTSDTFLCYGPEEYSSCISERYCIYLEKLQVL